MTTALPRLRPLGLGELLDQTIRLYRRNFLKFIGIIALVQIPVSLLQMVFSMVMVSAVAPYQNPANPPTDPFEIFGPAYFIGLAGNLIVALLSFILIGGVATAAMTRAVAGSYLGESLGIFDVYRSIGRSWRSLLGALLLAGILGIGLFIWFIIPCVGWLTGLGIIAFFSMVILPMIAPIIVLEKQPASQSIRRAWDLARRRFWWVLGFVFVLFLFGQIVVTGPVTVVSVIIQFAFGGPFDLTTTEAVLQTVIQSLLQLIFAVIYLPLQLTAFTLMYLDLRVRTEGFDLALQSAATAVQPSEPLDLMAQAPAAEQTKVVTMTEMGYFALLSLGAGLLYILFVSIFAGLGFAMMSASGGPRGF
jgi:hypothetical protein